MDRAVLGLHVLRDGQSGLGATCFEESNGQSGLGATCFEESNGQSSLGATCFEGWTEQSWDYMF